MSESLADQQSDEFRRDDPEGWQGRPFGHAVLGRDLTPNQRYRAILTSRSLYKRSAYGMFVDRIVHATTGLGVTFKHPDRAVEAYLDATCASRTVRFDERMHDWIRNLLVDGEYILSFAVPKMPGGAPSSRMVVGRLEPDSVHDLMVSQFDADTILGVSVTGPDRRELTYRQATPDEMPPLDESGDTYRAVLYWRVNRLHRRGLPLLTRVLDKMHLLDTLVEQLAQKAEYTNRFWLHGKVPDKGTKKDTTRTRKDLKRALENGLPGDVVITNEHVEINVMAPDLKMADHQALFNILVEHVLGAQGLPRHWFGSGGEHTNRATAQEQGTPTWLDLNAIQKELKGYLEEFARFIVAVGIWSAALPAGVDPYTVEAIMPDIANRDSLRDAQELAQVGLGLDLAVARGSLTESEAAEIDRTLWRSKGYDVNLEGSAPAQSPGWKDRAVLPGNETRPKPKIAMPRPASLMSSVNGKSRVGA